MQSDIQLHPERIDLISKSAVVKGDLLCERAIQSTSVKVGFKDALTTSLQRIRMLGTAPMFTGRVTVGDDGVHRTVPEPIAHVGRVIDAVNLQETTILHIGSGFDIVEVADLRLGDKFQSLVATIEELQKDVDRLKQQVASLELQRPNP